MNSKQDSRLRDIWWIAVIFLGAILTSQCGNPSNSTPIAALTPASTPDVSDLYCSSSELLPREEVVIWVNVAVANQNIPVVYTWSTEGGEIISGQGTANITYRTPDTPGTYEVRPIVLSYLQVRCPSSTLAGPWLLGTHFGSPLESLSLQPGA